MNYELAKELKEAGFPFMEMVGAINVGNGLQCLACGLPHTELDGKYYITPLLSELIEACGEEFSSLEKDSTQGWIAYRRKEEPLLDGLVHPIGAVGVTAEIAVTRLWLMLNKRDSMI